MVGPVILLAIRILTAAALLGAAIALAFRSDRAAALTLAGLAGAALPLVRAWRATRGTALRPALVWASIAMAMAGLSQVVALGETFDSGRPMAGQVVYLTTLATFAALISVLNARTPGGGAWAILMAMLVVVFLVPWLEGSGLVREGGGWDRLRLTAPWTIFYGLIVVAGVTNFLPTRLAPAAVWVGVALVAEYLGLTRADWSHATRGCLWTAVPLCLALAAWFADVETLRSSPFPPGFGRLWAWFRDAWGVVWALRVQERFNRAAERSGWPIRLTWHGAVSTEDDRPPPTPDGAEATLAGLLRRFATADRIDEAAK